MRMKHFVYFNKEENMWDKKDWAPLRARETLEGIIPPVGLTVVESGIDGPLHCSPLSSLSVADGFLYRGRFTM